MRRAPAKPGVCAVCECVALLRSRNMTCVRPPCTARSREDSLHTSQFRLNILHFTSHTSHLISSHTLATLDTQQTFTQRSFYTQKPEAFAHRSFYTEKLLHRKAFTQRSFSHRSQQFLHTASFYTEKPEAFAHRSFYTHQAFEQKSFYTEKLLHT